MAQRDLPANSAHQGDHAYASPYDDSYQLRPHGTRRRSGGWWWKLPLIAMMLLVGAVAAGAFWIDRAYAERVYPNVSVQGVDVAGKTRAEMQHAVEASFAPFLQSPVTLRSDDARWQPSLADLGVTVDWDRSFQQAFAVGHSGSRAGDLLQIARMAQQPTNVPLYMVVDGTKLDAYLQQVASEVDQTPQEASVTVERGVVEMTPSANGRIVLLSETANMIVDGLQQLQPQEVAIQTREVQPQITTERAAEVKRDVETMVGAPLELVAADKSFTLSPETLAEFVKVERVERDGNVTLNAQLDARKLETFLHDITAEVGQPPVEPRVNWNNGQLEIFEAGKPGYGVDIEQATKTVDAAVRTASRRIELPMGEVQPQARPETLASMGITELIAEGKSKFAGSAAYRVKNIKAGVKLLHGMLIAPGAEFSFNDTVGDLTPEKGFTQGYAIVGNRSQLEYGGGICQDSTTLYRAAFYAGLPIVDRSSHSYRISWYEQGETIGMDAAIFTGSGPDLRFANDTGNWLLLQGTVNEKDSSVTFAFYGTKVPGRTVERSEPVITNQRAAPAQPVYIDDPEIPVGVFKQTDKARGGMDVVVTRTIKDNGQVVRQEDFVTQFRPWPNIYLKNPATPKP
jgi:vancomycin resistance protein YoaR